MPGPFEVEFTEGRAPGTEGEADTHGMTARGAGGAAIGNTTIANIVLPAGGDWRIFGFWGQVVPATATAAEVIGGHISFQATAGDLTPDPSPTKFPIPAFGSFLGAAAPVQVSPLRVYPIDYVAPGKASIDLIYHTPVALTVAPQVAMGIIFGKTIPPLRPFVFMDGARTTVAGATPSAVGTLVLAEKASRITWISGIVAQDGVLVAGEELIGIFKLDSDDIKMTPAEYPLSAAIGAGLGTAIGSPAPIMPVWIPVSIPVKGGARIDCTVDLNTAITNAADVEIFVAYE